MPFELHFHKYLSEPKKSLRSYKNTTEKTTLQWLLLKDMSQSMVYMLSIILRKERSWASIRGSKKMRPQYGYLIIIQHKSTSTYALFIYIYANKVNFFFVTTL